MDLACCRRSEERVCLNEAMQKKIPSCIAITASTGFVAYAILSTISFGLALIGGKELCAKSSNCPDIYIQTLDDIGTTILILGSLMLAIFAVVLLSVGCAYGIKCMSHCSKPKKLGPPV